MPESPDSGPIYALNLFNLADNEDYRSYSRRSTEAIARHRGHAIALGMFRRSESGDIAPRQVLILVEWASKADFDAFCDDPTLTDLHPLRINGTTDYIWHLFDKIDTLRPIFQR